MPKMYIIAGCNGAGKTTASYTVLPEMLHCNEFVNADEIAKGLSPFNPESVAIDAGRIMLSRINSLMNSGVDFAFETTLAVRSFERLIKTAQSKGYFVTLLYFLLSSPEHAVERVAMRVMDGGHNIPTEIIYRRYRSGIKNLFSIYMPICDYWLICDNTEVGIKKLASGEREKGADIAKKMILEIIENYE
ncbi:MAG: zeta toxin family protein [Bacteroidales bacterium]